MKVLQTTELQSEEERLASEAASPTKREYIGGLVYAMAGASKPHCFITANVMESLVARLRGQRCRASSSDTKIRVLAEGRLRFCNPDTVVICDPSQAPVPFHETPAVIVEVLSASTRRTDEGEKLDACTSMTSLRVYLMIEQDRPFIVAHRRTDAGFIREVYAGMEAVVPLPEIGAALPLAEACEAIVFTPEEEPEEPA